MSLGFVIGESKATFVTAMTSRALSVGEYVKINSDEGEILGLVERSTISSAAFTDVKNFDEASESTEIAEINKRDKTFTAHIGILGFLENLRRGQSMTPAIPPIPGTKITPPTKQDLEEIFSPKKDGWVSIGNLLRNKSVDAKVNLELTVAQRDISLRDILEMEAGDVIPVEISDELILKANGIPTFRGKLGVSRSSLAYKVSEQIKRVDNH